jgi:hypothetical protein
MPEIPLSYSYADGTTLDVDAHNDMVYGEAGTGIMATANGELDANNVVSTFEIEATHVMPEQACIAKQEWLRETSTVFSDGVGSSSPAAQYFVIPGCSLRFYQPYDVSLALFQWSVFMSQTKWNLQSTKNGEISPPLNIIAQLDGVDLDHTFRTLPETHVMERDLDRRPSANEMHNALWFDMSHAGTLTKGWHELRVMMHMSTVQFADGRTAARPLSLRIGSKFRVSDYYLFQKASFGIRNARVLTML